MNTGGTGGKAKILEGGLEEDRVVIQMRSAAEGDGFDFQIDIYGHKSDSFALRFNGNQNEPKSSFSSAPSTSY